MNTKSHKLLLTLIFLFLFAGNGCVNVDNASKRVSHGPKPDVENEYWKNGNLKIKTHYKN